MRLSRFAFALSLCSAALAFCSTVAASASAALDRFGRFLLDVFTPASPKLVLAGTPAAPLSITGIALARSTQQGLRHEAGVSRRAAARHT